ncbi:Histidine--tRNA ligase [Gemmata sp. SH-PL17]|uniref:histidine--tRNA ligase n=1 Tax=Gemmata sp. SH-PL17 TaxID=1630693 RepID=UPI00078C3584|nr:HisS family protein [Gemmata sp. SH-PL17]AMV24365.1 Histidine--tRNA ligase [Gemmata sp. SH-PL17]
MSLITPRTLSGFRDYLPAVMLAREEVLRRAREVYRSYGFTPIDTPACESLDVLLGKGGDESDKLVYRVLSARGDKAEMGLRFDLTVPFARFSAQYINELGTPFKRYAMGPVWRGERPGQGRYREFWQCDFDTIGTTSNAADIETALVINDLFTAIGFDKFEIRINNRKLLNGVLNENGLGQEVAPILRAVDKLPKVGPETVKQELIGVRRELVAPFVAKLQELLNQVPIPANLEQIKQIHRSILEPLTQELISAGAAHVTSELPSILLQLLGKSWKARIRQDSSNDSEITEIRSQILREQGPSALTLSDQHVAIAKRKAYQQLDNWAAGELANRMTGVGLSPNQADAVLEFVSLAGTNTELLGTLLDRYGENNLVREGVRDLLQLIEVTAKARVPEERIKIDLSIARGLDYYTGTIYETFLTDLPGIGSVCSGGRYDNLASKYTKQVLPGVGASLGVDRLIAAMEELKHPLLTGQTTPAQVLIVNFDATRLGDYQRIARALRAACVNVEVYPDTTKKIGTQFAYAEKRGFKLAVVAGPAEFEQGVWKVKDLAKREEAAVPEAELVERIKQQV